MEESDKRNFKEKKEKKSYIIWKDNDMDSSSDLENEIINLGHLQNKQGLETS